MFRQIRELLFGDPHIVFACDGQNHKSHVEGDINVMASEIEHQTYFTELEAVICGIFNTLPIEEQPLYIADMGCGDGSLLRKIYEIVQTKSARGSVLDRHPLILIGIDYNEKSLAATGHNLSKLPHLLLQGDIANPQRLLSDLQKHGIQDPKDILHVRSFLDHDRLFHPLEDEEAAKRREGLGYSGIYVTPNGQSICAAEAVQCLVEHLSRWKGIVSKLSLG